MSHFKKVEERVTDIFRQTGALSEGHFKLRSGLHGLVYQDAWQIYASDDPEDTEFICACMAELILERVGNDGVDMVIGPERGAIWIALGVARYIYNLASYKVGAVFAEKDSESDEKYPFGLSDAWAAKLKGKRVVVVEDVSTTGGSTNKVCDLVREAGGTVVMVCTIWNRGGLTAEELEVPVLDALVNVKLHSYCPGCQQGLPFDN